MTGWIFRAKGRTNFPRRHITNSDGDFVFPTGLHVLVDRGRSHGESLCPRGQVDVSGSVSSALVTHGEAYSEVAQASGDDEADPT